MTNPHVNNPYATPCLDHGFVRLTRQLAFSRATFGIIEGAQTNDLLP